MAHGAEDHPDSHLDSKRRHQQDDDGFEELFVSPTYAGEHWRVVSSEQSAVSGHERGEVVIKWFHRLLLPSPLTAYFAKASALSINSLEPGTSLLNSW